MHFLWSDSPHEFPPMDIKVLSLCLIVTTLQPLVAYTHYKYIYFHNHILYS